MNRSIYLENQKLYHNLLRLYRTRNKIVHLGAPINEDPNERISINEEGANLAFDIALDTFHWAGIKRFQILRIRKHIIVK
jgi:hypothetical protein